MGTVVCHVLVALISVPLLAKDALRLAKKNRFVINVLKCTGGFCGSFLFAPFNEMRMCSVTVFITASTVQFT